MAQGSGTGGVGPQVMIGGAVLGAAALAGALFVFAPGDGPGPETPQPEVPQQAVLSPDTPVVPSPEVPADPEPAPTPQEPETTLSAPDTAAEEEGESDQGHAFVPDPPVLDVVRIEADGTAVLAGTAAADVVVRVSLDAKELAQVNAGGDGKFVVFATIPPSDRPQLLSAAMLWQGDWIEAPQSVIVAPRPVAVAQAEPEAEPAPEMVAEAQVTDPAETGATGAETPETVPETSGGTPDERTPEAQTPDPATAEAASTEGAAEEAEPAQAPAAPEPAARPEAPAIAQAPEADAPAEADQTSPPAPVRSAQADAEEVPAEGSETATDPVGADASGADGDPETGEAASTQTAPANEDAAPEATTRVAGETGRVSTAQSPELAHATPEPVDTTTPAAPQTAAEPQAPAVLVADEDGVRVIQPAPGVPSPEVMSTVALDTISYDAEGEVNLAGRGAEAGAFVRVYLDNAPVTTSRIAEDGSWRADLPQVDTGVYVLRVDEVDEDGAVTSRVETPFQREDPEDLAQARTEAGAAAAPISVVTVQPGASLWAIARERYGSGYLYVKVFEANRDRIRNPDLIYPGQIFDLPKDAPIPTAEQ